MSPPTISLRNCSRFGPEKSNYSSRSKPILMEWRRKQPETTQNESSVELGSGRNGLNDGVKLDGSFREVFEGPIENLASSGIADNEYSNGYSDKPGYFRSKPRFMKWRMKQTETSHSESYVKLDVGEKREVKVDITFKGVSERPTENSIFSGSTESVQSNGCGEHFGNFDIGELGLGVNLSECVFNPGTGSSFTVPGDGKSSAASQNGISKLDIREEHQPFVFTACKNGFGSNQSSQNKDYVFGLDKNGLEKELHFENGQFVFGVNGNNTGSDATFTAKEPCRDSTPSKLDEFQKFDDVGNVDPPIFVFGVNNGASMAKNVDQHYSGKIWNNDESAKENASSVTGRVPCFNFSSSWIDESRKENFLFSSCRNDYNACIDLDKAKNKSGNQSNFAYSGNESVDNEIKFQNVSEDGAFAFVELESGATGLVNKKNQLNREKVKDCGEFREHKQSISVGTGFTYRNGTNSDVTSENYACNLSDEMNRLNINNSNVFVFGSVKTSSDPLKQNHMNNNIPDSQLNNACEVPVRCKGEKYGSFNSKHDGFDLSNADYSTPNTNFSFSNLRFDPGVEKGPGITHSKLQGGKRLNKANGKPKRSTLVQDLFSQDCAGIDSSKETETSPICGSPMDFSPYQDPGAGNVSTASVGTGIEGEEMNARKEISDECESHDNKSNLNVDTSLSVQDGLSAIKRQYRKKYKLKVGPSQRVQGNNPEKLDAKQSSQGITSHEECENWRIRGNQAYQAGKLSKAEECYSKGIRSASNIHTPGYSAKSLLLCYSNRAATRMSLGRLREAIDDCIEAAALDPSFVKVALRAGNCYLILGEVESATQSYSKCLESGTEVCLDRRVTVDAGDGLYKSKSVAEYMSRSAKLLLEGTNDAAGSALENIEKALSISIYSEKLLEMKAQALCILRKYEKAIELCEQTLHNAKKNFATDPSDDLDSKNSHMSFWRQYVQGKCHYHLGKLDLALEIIERHGRMPTSSESGDLKKESSIALAASIHELLCLKKSGNEAFKSGKYTEAVEHYTAAISKSVDSRPFMAICFCNRAAAYQSMNQILDAIADCSLAIALDENYQKAISRRATLHETIRDYKQAVNDKQRLISLFESQNASNSGGSGGSSVKDIRKAYRHLSTIEEKAKMETSLDLYLILGIKASDTDSEIKKAYRKAALRHHPDKAGQTFARSDSGDGGILWKEVGEKIHSDADKLFKVIGEAYAILSDPSKRSKYDIEEDIRNGRCNYSESMSRNCSSGRPSTSYNSSPYGKSSSGRQTGGYGNSRKHWYESRSSSSYDERW